ncbi:VOC family protein [Streptomyces litchfieldiae]|uniref:VOC family protein n=1 Tax=Streptomyces litchfieldiae TaxID=3075543 RepID=A0ABU2MJD8_9ACTN|nr:VOC family protein [Streptomyces sp. DSM 44938]MDT0341720.1 VOC family protein [Streptomyces sp. DSM 44938]
MITSIAITTVWSTDQERDVAFFTEKLGFEVRSDVPMGDTRWVTVGVPGQPDMEYALMRPDGPGLDPESARMLTALVTKGVLGAGALRTDDCRADHRRLADAGVEFVQEPQERPYGIEAIFRDPTGNWYSLTERREGLDMSKPWG